MAQPSRRTIGGYSLGSKIRTGSLFSVFQATDNLGRELEVTCYRAAVLRDRMSKEAFLEEARRSASIHHENLCLTVDAGEEGEVWFTASVATDAPSLRDLLNRGGALAEERVRVVAEGASSALGHLAESELRHGDIRPETVFLAGGRVLLAPRRLVPLSLSERDPRYLSPEEIRTEGTDVRADLFALGVVLWEALSGDPPFPTDSPDEALTAIRSGPPPLSADVSEEFQRLIGVLLAEDPGHRPADPRVIRRAIRGEILLAPPPGAIPAGPYPEPPAPPESAPAAASPGPVAPAPGAAPGVVAAAFPPSRRDSGRLVVGGEPEEVYDLVDEAAYLSIGRGGKVQFGEAEAAGDLAHIERGPEHDALVVAGDAEPRPRVNGSLVDRHDLAEGDRIEVGDTAIRYEILKPAPRRSGPPERGPRKGAMWLALVTVGLCLAVIAISTIRGMKLRKEGQEVLAAADRAEEMLRNSDAGDASGQGNADNVDRAAEAAFNSAQTFASANPLLFEAIRRKYQHVRSVYPLTRWDHYALREIEKNEERRQEWLTGEFQKLLEQTTESFEAGRLYEAYLAYRNFADDHPDTRFADRADREAENLAEVIQVRYEEDIARADAAAENGDFGVALDILSGIDIYGTPENRTRARQKSLEIKALIHETQLPDGEPSPGTPPERIKPTPGPEPTPEPSPPPATEAAEAKAMDIFEAGETAVGRQNWKRAVEELSRLKKAPHNQTRFYLENEPEISRLLGLSELERDGYAGLFHGEVEMGRGNHIRITYTFETAEEEEDWQYIKPFADQQLGAFHHEGNTMRGKGVGALVHSAVFKADSLTLSTRVKAVVPHDFGVQFFEPETMMKYYLYVVQNRYFTIGSERTPVPENVIWICGGNAWSDTPNGEIGFIFTARRKTPPVSADEWLDLVAKKEGKGVSFSIKKAGPLQGSAAGDDGYVIPAIRPALFVLRSEAVFDTVVLEGTLDDGWARGAMNRARQKFHK